MNAPQEPSRFRQAGRSTARESEHQQALGGFFERSAGSTFEKLENFAKYVPRQNMARFLCLHELFQMALPVQGDIIECGVNWGGGLMSFAQFSAIHEPVNLQRRIVGFDTFEGFTAISPQDEQGALPSLERRPGGYAAQCLGDLQEAIGLFDRNRFIGHIEKVVLVQGDIAHTLPRYLAEQPHTVVSLLHLDLDLYAPTKVAIEHLVPRMPRGAVLVFDELNNRTWPGETVAVMEALGLNRLRIRRFPYEPHVSYAVIE